MTETVVQIIDQLQQQLDKIDEQIALKKSRMSHFKGPMERMIGREIDELDDRRKNISDRILALKLSNQQPFKPTTT